MEKKRVYFVNEITPGIVEKVQDCLGPKETDQNLDYIVLVDPDGSPRYRISAEDEIFIGHFRDDRASYFSAGLQRRGFKHITGYIKFSNNYEKNGGRFILPEKILGVVDNNYFEILYKKGRNVKIISENEKRKHVGRNAHGRNEKLWPNEEQVSIPMKQTTCEYADVPEMNSEIIGEYIVRWLDNNKVTDIIANILSSDMMKHTGNYESAKKGNEAADRALGLVKDKIDLIAAEFFADAKNKLKQKNFDNLRNTLDTKNFDNFLAKLKESDNVLAEELKTLSKKVPILVVTADHGASESGLKEIMTESNVSHTANQVPYIIYDPLRKTKIDLKDGMTIRNNAATLLTLLGFNESIPLCYEEGILPDDYKGYDRRLIEIVLDGWGINPDQNYAYDAIMTAQTPVYDWLIDNASFVKVSAHGEVIGLRKVLSEGKGAHHDNGLQPGATDIGHLHLFSGRLIKQPIVLIDEMIKPNLNNGAFDESDPQLKPLVDSIKRAIDENVKFHHISFGSEGGVHACLSHLYAVMRLAKKLGMSKKQFIIHLIAEGRDVLIPRSAHLFLREVIDKINKIGIGVVATVFGRADWVRKDGYEYITDRAVSALCGDFSMLEILSLK